MAVCFNRWRHCSRSRGFHAGDGSVAAAGGFAAAGDFAVAGDFSVADGMHLAAGGRGGRLSKTLWGVRTLHTGFAGECALFTHASGLVSPIVSSWHAFLLYV